MAAISLSTLLVYVVVLPAMLYAVVAGIVWAVQSLHMDIDLWLWGLGAVCVVMALVWLVGFSGWIDTSS